MTQYTNQQLPLFIKPVAFSSLVADDQPMEKGSEGSRPPKYIHYTTALKLK